MLSTRLFSQTHRSCRTTCAILASRQNRHVGSRATQVDVEVVGSPAITLKLAASTPDTRQIQSSETTAAEEGGDAASITATPVMPEGFTAVTASGDGRKVADLDAQRFQLHPSVFYWRDFKSVINTMWATDSDISFASSVQQLTQRAAESFLLQGPQAAAYWAYHSARLTFFAGQAAAGLLAHHVSEALPASITSMLGLPGGPRPDGSLGGDSSTSSGRDGSSGGAYGKKTPLERILANGREELGSRFGEAIATFQQDYDNIRAGYYGLPWDMTPSHRQNNPLFMARRTAQAMQESAVTLRRRVRGQPEPVWLQGSMYPPYYAKTFHYQTDGWMSDRSARIYEHMTELLFFGRQDAMQRTSLLPLADFLREAQQGGRRLRDMRLLEVAAGTGRFHTFIKDCYPDLPSVVSDLSPFYLARARENLRYWRATRQPSRHLGGPDDTGADFLQTAAEGIAAPDESFDIVVCVYLFHELPEPVRIRAVSEFFRVLRPGGLMVFTDSVQLGDRPAWDNAIGLFTDFNEPYYRNYISCDLGAMFEAAGFVCGTKYVSSATKTLSFRKPGTLDPSAQ